MMQPIDGTTKDITAVIKDRAASEPEGVFITFSEQTYTWKDIDICSDYVAQKLREIGVKKGTHVGIFSKNTPNWIITFMALRKLGAFACLLNYGYTHEELIKVIGIGDITCICHEVSDPAILEGTDCSLFDIGRETDFRKLAAARPVSFTPEVVEMDDPFVMIYTSGSTGTPKGVLLSLYNLVSCKEAGLSQLKLSPSDVIGLFLPMFHIFGIITGLFGSVYYGCVLHIFEKTYPPVILKELYQNGCTFFPSVPTMMIALMDLPDFSSEMVSSVRVTIVAGAAISETQLMKVHEMFTNMKIIMCYGLSEIAPATETGIDDDMSVHLTTVGKIVGQNKLEIWNTAEERFCKTGEVGEVIIKGESLMTCYYKVPVEQQTIDGNGWLHTGDLGFLDDKRYLHLTGRIKDLIIRGGENIMPQEIADVINQIPEVLDSKVVGVSDSVLGEAVCACIEPKEGCSLSEDAVTDYLKPRLSRIKLPAYFMFFDSFPKLSNGKLDSVTIKRQAEEKFGKTCDIS